MRKYILLICFFLGGCLIIETEDDDHPGYYGRPGGVVRHYEYRQPYYGEDRRWLRRQERREYRREYYRDDD